jgi:hypothetical protein
MADRPEIPGIVFSLRACNIHERFPYNFSMVSIAGIGD